MLASFFAFINSFFTQFFLAGFFVCLFFKRFHIWCGGKYFKCFFLFIIFLVFTGKGQISKKIMYSTLQFYTQWYNFSYRVLLLNLRNQFLSSFRKNWRKVEKALITAFVRKICMGYQRRTFLLVNEQH